MKYNKISSNFCNMDCSVHISNIISSFEVNSINSELSKFYTQSF